MSAKRKVFPIIVAFLLSFLLAVLFCGCRTGSTSNDGSSGKVGKETTVDEEGWNVTEYYTHVSSASDLKYRVVRRKTALIGNKFYSLLQCEEQTSSDYSYSYEFCSYDLSTKESTNRPFLLADMDIIAKPDSFSVAEFDAEYKDIISMEAADGELIITVAKFPPNTEENPDQIIEHLYTIRLEPEGPVKEITDLGEKVRDAEEEYLSYPDPAYFDDEHVLMLKDQTLTISNETTGEKKNIYKFKGLNDYDCKGIYRSSENEIFVCYEEWGDACLYKLDNIEHPDTVELTLMMDFNHPSIENCVADYNRSHPGVKINVEYLEAAFDDTFAWAKLIQKIKDGDGPDLIWTSRARLEALKNAGAVDPLDELISDEVKENVFAGVLKFGEIDGQIYTMPYEASLEFLFVDDENFAENSWTLTEALTAYENLRAKRSDASFVGKTVTHMMMAYLCTNRVEHSEFIDLDTMTCDFKNENFYRLLKFCKDNAESDLKNFTGQTDQEKTEEYMKGNSLARVFAGGLMDYSEMRKSFGESSHPTGFPSENGAVATIYCYRGMAMSKLSEHKEIAADFITLLTEEDYQVRYNIDDQIRKDVLKKHVKNAWELPPRWTPEGEVPEAGFVIFNGARRPLACREDGSSYLDEYIELMESGVPLSNEYDIQAIIREETAAYFEGSKTEQEVAEIIQSRVQIYLSERN